MGASLRRAGRRACFIAAAICLAFAIVAPGSTAQEAGDDGAAPPEVFRGAASASVASVQLDREALLPINDVFRFIVLDTASAYESSVRNARASLFFPGNGAILGPSLLCTTFGGAFPPEFAPILELCNRYQYPLSVVADESVPDGATTGSLQLGRATDPISGNAIRAAAHAAEDGASSDAVIADLRVLGLPPFGAVLPLVPDLILDTSILSVDGATSRTDQRIEDGRLVVDAEASLTGVRLLGGLVRIGAVRSEAHVTDDAQGERTADAGVEVSGVTVAGLPAQITEEGLVVGSPTGALGPLLRLVQDQVNELLRRLGITIALLDVHEAVDEDGSAVASAEGVLVSVAVDVQGLPPLPLPPLGDIEPNGTYVASVQLGASAARGAAFDVPVDEPTDGGSTVGGSSGSDGAFVPPSDGSLDLPELPGAESPRGPEVDVGGGVELSDVFDDRLGLVVLALMLATLGLCLVPPLSIPARLPGPRA